MIRGRPKSWQSEDPHSINCAASPKDLGMHMGDEELKSYDTLLQANYAAY